MLHRHCPCGVGEEVLIGLIALLAKHTPGFKAYLVLNSDGIVIRWDSLAGAGAGDASTKDGNGGVTPSFAVAEMTYQQAVQHAHHVTTLYSKSVMTTLDILGSEEGPMENVRMRTDEYEMVISSVGSYTCCCICSYL